MIESDAPSSRKKIEDPVAIWNSMVAKVAELRDMEWSVIAAQQSTSLQSLFQVD